MSAHRARRDWSTAFALGLLSAIAPVHGAGQPSPQPGGQPGTGDERVIACEDVKDGDRRPGTGCWNVGRRPNVTLNDPEVFWQLRRFPDWQAAEAAAGATGIVVAINEEVWLSTVGPRMSAAGGTEADTKGLAEQVAAIGPLRLPRAASYELVLSYVSMPAGSRSPVHALSGPKAWFLLEGEQCLETVVATTRATAGSDAGGSALTAPSNVPMQLVTTGPEGSRALALDILDATQTSTLRPNWTPSGACM